MTWRDVAGLDEIISELQDTVILPFQKRHLFGASKLLQPPKGETRRKHLISQFFWILCFPSYSCCTLGLHDKSCFNRDHDHCFSQLNRHNHLQYLPSGLFILIIYALFCIGNKQVFILGVARFCICYFF